ncbi:uncharacterized protein LOC115456048 isoform X2 [Manduca sexta]|nr:uncharacterized protein LOC115456048 isoform X2 [Manduca sexta]
MRARLFLLALVILCLTSGCVDADFWFNRITPKKEDLDRLKLKCIPGRTVIRVQTQKVQIEKTSSSEEDDYVATDGRRTHMNYPPKDDLCQVCVCSVEGKDEYCSKRPAMNVNECMRMAMLMDRFKKNIPFEHERDLSYRIRRVGTAPGGPKKCIPFVSEYTDCTDENQCSGCTKCTCTVEGTWSCTNVNKCEDMFRSTPVDDNDIETALLMMDSEMKRERKKKATSSNFPFVPQPTTQNSVLIEKDDNHKINIADEIMDLMRPKRSVDRLKENNNHSVMFYHTLDEVNEDTLKNTNESGTVKARKLNVDLPKLSRRAGVLLNDNTSNPLHIEYNKADMYPHINDNKIDASPHREDKYDIHEVIGNYSQRHKDRELSKVIVKEMKSGVETIGDKNAPVMSNVSFTPENETFAAMTYIAGNLLNKLWNMETDSSETIETEVLKHEKIAELLDLFKEPLTINQEMLLKNAIEQLSTAIDKNKDIRNVSLCEQLGEVKQFLNRSNLGAEKKTKECDKEKTDAKEVIGNVNNVINLVKKLQYIQSHMETISKDQSGNIQKTPNNEFSGVIKGVKTSDNSFGGVLGQIIRLLLPVNANKRLTNRMKKLNIFEKDYDFNNRFKNIFHIALGNITMTIKDKIILDYLTHIENSPDCLLHEKKSKTKFKPVPSIEGNILLNLSEFFKMKSLTDLLQLVGSGKVNGTKTLEKKQIILRSSESTTKQPTSTEAYTAKTTDATISASNKLAATKAKLKAHLKTILEDLVEMQNARGLPKNSDIKITDVLPCIYNILNADKAVQRNEQQEPADKLSSIFNNLKRELKYASYRRSSPATERPKSAIVWERLVRSLNQKQKTTRRNMDQKAPKSVNELKKMMDDREAGSNTYKNIAILADIPAADRLTLLKTLDVDVKKYITVLENIKVSLEAGVIPGNKISEFNEFVDNVANNININGKVIQKINKSKFSTILNTDLRKRKLNKLSYSQASAQVFSLPKEPVAFNTKITRDQIINQLIKNRINMYIRIKEAEGHDLRDDINYDIAKKIQGYLELGNYGLAREMYNIFANRQRQIEGPPEVYPEPVPNHTKYSGQLSILDKEPLIQFEEPRTRRVGSPNQSHLLQQLINMKNLRI